MPSLIQAKFAPVKAAFGISDEYIEEMVQCNGDFCGDEDENGIEVPRYTAYVRIILNDDNREFLCEDDEEFWTFEDKSEVRPGPNGTTFYIQHVEQIFVTLGDETTYGFLFSRSDGEDQIDFGCHLTATEHLQIRDWFGRKMTGDPNFVWDDNDSEQETDNENQ